MFIGESLGSQHVVEISWKPSNADNMQAPNCTAKAPDCSSSPQKQNASSGRAIFILKCYDKVIDTFLNLYQISLRKAGNNAKSPLSQRRQPRALQPVP